MRAQHRAVLGWLDQIGATAARIEPPRGLGHPRVCFCYGGQDYAVPIAGTPSSPFSYRAQIRKLRQMLGLTEHRKRQGERRPRRPGRSPRSSRTEALANHGRSDTRYLPPLNTPFAELPAMLGARA